MQVKRCIAAAAALLAPLCGSAPPVRAEQVCQVLDAARSRISLQAAVGAAAAEGRVTRFAGVLLLDPGDISASKVKVVVEPASVELDASPQVNALLQNLLQGVERQRVVFVSDRIAPQGGGSYLVSGSAEQGGRRERVSVQVQVQEMSAARTRLSGTLRRRGQGADGGALAGSAAFEASFNAQPMADCLAK